MTFLVHSATGYIRGQWRNGRGVSWEIASDGEADDFGWRMALAEIGGDAPFSPYPGVDRVFTLLSGDGLDLDVAGIGTLTVAERFAPVAFPGEAETRCRLRGGACRALNLFTNRKRFAAQVTIHETGGPRAVGHHGLTLLFALSGVAVLDGEALAEGDAAQLLGTAQATLAGRAKLYEARLNAEGR